MNIKKYAITKKYLVVCLQILVLIAFNSCSVKKRSYRNGYFVSWHGHRSKAHDVAHKTITKQEVVSIDNKDPERILLSSGSENKIIGLDDKPIANAIFNDDECNDYITMANGDRIKAKVLEVNENEIKYKRCDNINGPIITTSKKLVTKITYANAHEDVFSHLEETQYPAQGEGQFEQDKRFFEEKEKEAWNTSLSAFILMLLGMLCILFAIGNLFSSSLETIVILALLIAIFSIPTAFVLAIIGIVKASKAHSIRNRIPRSFIGKDRLNKAIALGYLTILVLLLPVLLQFIWLIIRRH